MREPRLTERLKQAVSDKAKGVCEYCRSQKDYSPDPFSVEHIIPRARGGTNKVDNLALSCHGCNGHKHIKIEAWEAVSRESVFLFHPRQQRWSEHFGWNGDFTFIVGLTATGRATIEALQLNRPGVVNLRRVLFLSGFHPPADQDPD